MLILIVSDNKRIRDPVLKILEEGGHRCVVTDSARVEIWWRWDWDVIISAHAKVIFPKDVVGKCRCVNIHPGLNPHNRGMFPHVFSIINGLPAGATIHEMDEFIDNGKIIVQERVFADPWDTSDTLYERIINTEIELFKNNVDLILTRKRGNINTMKDFNELCELNLKSVGTLEQHINLLRALTHGDHKNAYFVKDGEKIFVQIKLSKQ